MSSIMDERVTDEIEALEAILMDDVVIKRVGEVPQVIETVLHPSTGDDVEQQYVCVTLVVKLTPGYPDSIPEVTLRNPRGLDDDILANIHVQIREKIADCLGSPVIFELIELIRDCLTECNLPSGQCMICLFGFCKGDHFVRTQCYHYFHSHCLALHLISGRRYHEEEKSVLPAWQQATKEPFKEMCPVCRVILINIDVDALAKAPPPMASFTAPAFHLTEELKALQREMAKMMAYQMAKGGIIGCNDPGPPPLTITTPEDNENNVNNTSPTAAPEVVKAPNNNAINCNARQTGNSSNDNSAPGSPARPAYRGPYRGFNRRGKPGRRGRGAAR
ncbi:unnamed protein product [Spodoptera littoralis]|uniref:E3 ubiquitin-protein ligase RNF25 n=1 Tax=Spodoptera littoralis TaxID=7109 RepID=A0A9P0I1D9_SPOLI|nr:unnamed protein product [Spodoptera littoralis]CAH1638350.1 unnamed protein product [Spodoptera littoralis]